MERANETDNGKVLSHAESFACHSKKDLDGSKYKNNVTLCIVITYVEGLRDLAANEIRYL